MQSGLYRLKHMHLIKKAFFPFNCCISKLKKNKELNWAYITAYNPQSKKLSKPQNIKRHQNLVEYCNEIGYVFYAGEGTDRKGKWDPEKSLLIIGINIFTAKKLGKYFQQKAILCGSLNQLPYLVPCH